MFCEYICHSLICYLCYFIFLVSLKSAKEKERLAEENSDLSSAKDGSRVLYAPYSRFNSQEFSQPPAKIRKIISKSHITPSPYLNYPLFPVTPSLASRPLLVQTSTSLPSKLVVLFY